MGTRSFYHGQTAGGAVAELRANGYPIEYIDRALDDQELAATAGVLQAAELQRLFT